MKRGILDRYHIGDARNIASVLPDEEFVDVTITSPPYWNLKDYGSCKQVGFGQQYDEYLHSLKDIFASVYRITKKTGSLWIVVDTVKHKGELRLLPFDLAGLLKTSGWILHDIIIWHKDKTLPWSHRGKRRNIFEYILFFTKSAHFKYNLSDVREAEDLKSWWMRYPERYSPRGMAPTRTWSISIPRQGSWGASDNWVRHFCPLPPELVRRLVLLTTRRGDVVFDPFCGSGVVLAEAHALGRRYVGIDLKKSYRRMFEKRVLPSVAKLEAWNSESRTRKEKRKRAFAETIWRLRKTKLPRELIRLYERRYGPLPLLGVIAISSRPQLLKITLVTRNERRAHARIVPRLEGIMSKAPLSKYGLQATISVVSKAELAKDGVNSAPQLYIYQDGHTHHAVRPISLRAFLESLDASRNGAQQTKPPIASNVFVRISERKRLIHTIK